MENYIVKRITKTKIELTTNDITREYTYKDRHWKPREGWKKPGWYNYDGMTRMLTDEYVEKIEKGSEV